MWSQRFTKIIKILLCLQVVRCYAIENSNSWEECSNSSVSQEIPLDECEQCACLTGTASFQMRKKATCVITEEVLQRIMEELFEAWRIITGTYSSRSAQFHGNSVQSNETCNFSLRKFHTVNQPLQDDTCDSLISDIEAMIQDLTEQIRLLVEFIEDPDQFIPKIIQLEQCLKCVNKKLDDTIAEYEQDLGDLREKYDEMQQCLIDSINQKKEEIRQLEQLLVDKSYELVASNVNASNYVAAAEAFARLNNDTLLDQLVGDMYSLEKIENLLRFAYILEKTEQRERLYSKLLEFMQSHQHYTSIHFLSVTKIFGDDVKRICQDEEPVFCTDLPDMYRNLLKIVNTNTGVIVRILASNICSGDYKNTILACSPETHVNLVGEGLNEILPETLEQAYDRCADRFFKLSTFVGDLRWNQQRITGLSKLLNITQNSNDKLKVALKMKHAEENLSGPDGHQEEAQASLLILRNTLSRQLQNLVWHTSCIIYNSVQYDKHIYTYNTISPDNKAVIVGTEMADTSRWVYKPIERSDGEYVFQIRNQYAGDFLASHKPARYFSDDFDFVAASTDMHEEYPARIYHWQIQFDETENNVKLFHVGRQAYLVPSTAENAVLDLVAQENQPDTNWINECDTN